MVRETCGPFTVGLHSCRQSGASNCTAHRTTTVCPGYRRALWISASCCCSVSSFRDMPARHGRQRSLHSHDVQPVHITWITWFGRCDAVDSPRRVKAAILRTGWRALGLSSFDPCPLPSSAQELWIRSPWSCWTCGRCVEMQQARGAALDMRLELVYI